MAVMHELCTVVLSVLVATQGAYAGVGLAGGVPGSASGRHVAGFDAFGRRDG